MMYLFIIIGITLAIIKANTAFIIANWIIYTCFGVAGGLFLIHIVSHLSIKNQMNKMTRRW